MNMLTAHITPLLILTLASCWLGCGEELAMEDLNVEESEEFITHQQAIQMDLDANWYDQDTMLVSFNFTSHHTIDPHRICVRAKGLTGWDCKQSNVKTPSTSDHNCYGQGCRANYFIEAHGPCGYAQEVRVQEGYPPFYRETKWKTLHTCPHGGTFVPASGGYKAGCELDMEAPAGTTGFTYDGHFYHNPSSPGWCPSGSTFDGINCKVMPIPGGQGFVRWPGRFLYRPNNCPAP